MYYKVLYYLRLLLLILLILGLALNFLVKDYIWIFAGLFYLLPIRLLFIISILYLILSIKNKFHRITSILLFVSFSLLLMVTDTGFIKSNSNTKIVVWNAAREETSTNDIVNLVKNYSSEVYIFIEFDKAEDDAAEKVGLEILLPEYKLHRLSGNMAILSKVNSNTIPIDSSNDTYNYFNIIEVDKITYAIVDIGSWPFYNRSKPFKELLKLVNKYDVDIIAGDFNTPYNSIQFDDLTTDYNCGNTHNIFNRETFPSFFPLVSLDHIWIKKIYMIKKYSPIEMCVTDHYPLQLDYE